MKERGILYKPKMHIAVMLERKTQTRRIIKPQPVYNTKYNSWAWKDELFSFEKLMRGYLELKAPLGKPGDKLYVKEAIASVLDYDDDVCHHRKKTCYKLDYEKSDLPACDIIGKRVKWKSPLFMPKVEARTWTEIKSVRVQRLQAISELDSIWEGVEAAGIHGELYKNYTGLHDFKSARNSFKTLWDSINEKPKPVYKEKRIVFYESYPWEAPKEKENEYRGKPLFIFPNPWVFVYKFKLIR